MTAAFGGELPESLEEAKPDRCPTFGASMLVFTDLALDLDLSGEQEEGVVIGMTKYLRVKYCYFLYFKVSLSINMSQ
jgi:hypothetical protein